MALKAGLVGLPNVGKSTLFNALTQSSIPAENYPFCTVDPHVAITSVPDNRVEKLAHIFQSKKTIPAVMQFVDIAGLVKGASQGEGLGNQFLSNIMGVDLIVHVVRCFDDSAITHVHDKLDPLDDLEVIHAELMLKDLESVEKRTTKLESMLKKAHQQKKLSEIKILEAEQKILVSIKKALEDGSLTDVQTLVQNAKELDIDLIHLLCAKNFLVVANFSEDDFSEQNYKNNLFYQKLIQEYGQEKIIPICAKTEYELLQLSEEDALELIESLGLQERGLESIIKKAYESLDLITFFTAGPQEIHAWSIMQGSPITKAAGTIHSDMERGFICAEVYSCDDLFSYGSEKALKDSGKIRTEGKDYKVRDGDVILIRFNV